MCRLLLTIGPAPESIYHSFRELAIFGRVPQSAQAGHLDGWGWAWVRKDGLFALHKEATDPRNLACAQIIEEICRERPEMVIGHLRKASPGMPVLAENTHPFQRGNWTFAHNGTLFDSCSISLERYQPQGSGDSERIFLFVLERLEKVLSNRYLETLAVALEELETYRFTALNFILSDGKEAFICCRYSQAEDADYYTLYETKGAGFRAICSEPLRNGDWTPLANRTLLKFSGGISANNQSWG